MLAFGLPSALAVRGILPIAFGMPRKSWKYISSKPAARNSSLQRSCGLPLLLIVLVTMSHPSFGQSNLNLFGAGVPLVADGNDTQPVVVGTKIFSDVAGKVLGCSFYKAPANIGVHVVTLWDATGKILATQTATGETASGKQSVTFAAPVAVAANQTFTCGYYAPVGNWSYDKPAFVTQLNVPPLHVPANGGVFVYGTTPTQWPTSSSQRNYWVDVIFSTSTGSSTWISGTNVSTAGSTASVTWNTAVPADSQVEYGATAAYGTSTTLVAARAASHSVAVSGLSPGTTYHFRVRSRDSDSVLAVGPDYTVSLALPVAISESPLTGSIASGTTQQFLAMVSNTPNVAVIWTASSGTINSSGLFTAPTVSASTPVTVSATSLADPTKSAVATMTVTPPVPAIAASPTTLTFSGQTGATALTPASVNITNGTSGSLAFTATSDSSWLVTSPASGTAPSSLRVSPAITGMKAGTYTGHVTLAGGGSSAMVTVALTLTAPPIQHSVALSWMKSPNTTVVSYNVYRSTTSGASYALSASAVGGISYADQTVQSGSTYFYVVTAVDDLGRESPYSSQTSAVIP
jgi:hypothetical protein